MAIAIRRFKVSLRLSRDSLSTRLLLHLGCDRASLSLLLLLLSRDHTPSLRRRRRRDAC